MSHLFFGRKLDGDAVLLDEEEAKHSVRVLRHKVGDRIMVTTGEGFIWEGLIAEARKSEVLVKTGNVLMDHSARPNTWLAVAPTKNLSRIEWLIEKGTELGLRRFTPLITEHGEKTRIRKDRLERIALAAVKQSFKAWMPVIDEPVDFQDFLKNEQWENWPGRYMGYCGTGEKAGLMEDYSPGSDVIVLIGPEGDFSQSEVSKAQSSGFRILDLGTDRFRTETAALHVVSIVYELNRHAKKI